jgi:hypothetical protein
VRMRALARFVGTIEVRSDHVMFWNAFITRPVKWD